VFHIKTKRTNLSTFLDTNHNLYIFFILLIIGTVLASLIENFNEENKTMSKRSKFDDFETSELTIDDINKSEMNGIVDYYVDKASSKDVEQVKIYLGMVYFVVLAVLTITLFL